MKNTQIITGFILLICLITFVSSGLIIVLENDTVVGVHDDTELITLQVYPDANQIKKISDSSSVQIGDVDPTLENSDLLYGDWIPVNVVYADITFSKYQLCLNCPGDSVTITGELRSSRTEPYTRVSVSSSWPIALHNESGEKEIFMVPVYNGRFSGVLHAEDLGKTGKWYIEDREFNNLILPEDLAIFDTYTTTLPEDTPVRSYTVKTTTFTSLMTYKVVQ